jgi:hypothetical protein
LLAIREKRHLGKVSSISQTTKNSKPLPISKEWQASGLDKSAPSVQTGKFMFTYPMYEEDNCYFCTKQSKKLFDLPSDFFHRGNFVNSHNDGKNKLQA